MTIDEKFAEQVHEELEATYGTEELLADEHWDDVEGMRFGMRLVVVSFAVLLGVGAAAGLSIGIMVAALAGAFD